jgi:hypothetical protein
LCAVFGGASHRVLRVILISTFPPWLRRQRVLRILLAVAVGRGFSGARRMIAQPAVLIGPQRLRLRDVPGGAQFGRRLAQRELWSELLRMSQLLRSDFHSVGNCGRPCKHLRTHLVRVDRPADLGRHDVWLDARINRDPAVLDHRLIDHHRFAECHIHFPRREDHRCDVLDRELVRRHEYPCPRIGPVFDDKLLRRQRRPPEAMLSTAPKDPCGRPMPVGYPDPTDVGLNHPSPVVINDPAPFRLRGVGDPVPAPVSGVDPVSHRIGPPALRDVPGDPDVAPTRDVTPLAVWGKRSVEFGREIDLRLRLCRRDGRSGERGCAEQKGRAERHHGAPQSAWPVVESVMVRNGSAVLNFHGSNPRTVFCSANAMRGSAVPVRSRQNVS